MTKKVNPYNWLERDATLDSFVMQRPTGETEPISRQEWAELMLKPQLSLSVPKEIQRLFEGVRGAFIYGYFYYGLCFMGMIALFRVAEAALAHKCTELGALESGKSFDENVQWLVSKGIVQSGDWERIAEARSGGFDPQQIPTILEQAAEKINALFAVQND